MAGTRVVSWLRHLVTEFRLAVVLVVLGVSASLVGVVLYSQSRPGSPEVIIGLSCLITGAVMLLSRVRRH